jgi:protein gp37
MHPDWARSLRDQCVAAGVPFLFKQWGEFSPREKCLPSIPGETLVWPDGAEGPGNCNDNGGMGWPMMRVGKKAAGRLLDGRTWDEVPG